MSLGRTAFATVLLTTFSVLQPSSPLEAHGPQIVVEPPSRVLFSNSSGGRLDCRATGAPAPSVRWEIVGSGNSGSSSGTGRTAGGSSAGTPGASSTALASLLEIAGLRHPMPNGSLVFPPFNAADFRADVHRATYRCVAASAAGVALSRDVKVRAVVVQNDDLAARTTPQHVTVSRGNAAVLKCPLPNSVRSHVDVTSWLQDGDFNLYPSSEGDGKFHMLPTGELVILNINSADSMSTFQCRLTDRLSGQTRLSLAARVDVIVSAEPTPPRLSQETITVQARQDDLVILPCIASGHPPPDVRWEAVGSTGTRTSTGTTSASGTRFPTAGPLLLLPRARPQDSGRYVCRAFNSVGAAQMEATLLVTAPLAVRVQPPTITASLGRPVALRCTVSGHPVDAISWTKDGQTVTGTTMESSNQGVVSMLEIASVTREDQGIYQCFAKNEQDMVQGSSYLRLGDTPPQLIYRFIQQKLQPGPAVSFKCVASGNPTPNIKWTLDGFPLPRNERFVIGQYAPMHGDVISHVNITSVRVEDGGTYRCTASNRAGESFHQADLDIYGQPHVRAMGDISAVAGETLTVTCPAGGYPLDLIKWYKGDRLLPTTRRHLVFPNGTLVIQEVQAGGDSEGDGGVYRCTASYRDAPPASSIAHVTVMVPPKITPFSFRSDLHVGERVGVQCVVGKGDPPLEIRWLRNEQPLTTSSGVVVRSLDQFTSVLSIGALARDLGGNYTCVARNPAASTSHTAQLHVNVPPAISPFSFGELSAGERTRVTCSVKRGDQPLTISWLKDGQAVDPGGQHGWTVVRDLEDFSSVLSIPRVDSRHSGNYSCVVTNPARTAVYTAPLIVTVPPTWIVEPSDRETRVGDPALLDCQVDGFPRPTVSWKKATGSNPGQYQDVVTAQPVESLSVDESLSNPNLRVQLLNNGSLLIERSQISDAGQYLCEANNGIGVGLSTVVTLTVHAPAQFVDRPRQELGRRGQSATLVCKAVGDSPLHVSWRRNGTPLDMMPRISIRNSSENDGLRSELVVSDVRADDGGPYTCLARNHFGRDQLTINLLVQDVPGPVSNVRMVEQSSRQATVAWTPPQDGNSVITKYVLRYVLLPHSDSGQLSESGNTISTGASRPPSGPGFREESVESPLQSARLSNLRPASVYSVSVRAENALGAGPASSELRIRTESEAPSAAPRAVVVEAASSTQLRVSWSPPPPAERHGPLLGHYVGHRHIEDSDSESPQYNFTTVPVKGGSTVSGSGGGRGSGGRQEVLLSGLAKFRKFGVVVQAYNSRGPGPLSKEIVALTLEDVPEAPPREVSCLAKSPETIHVQWQPPPDSLIHGDIKGYRLIYHPEPSGHDDDLEPVTPQTKLVEPTLSSTLHGLLKFRNYSISVLAFTRVGDGNSSTPVYCRTLEDVPGAPAALKVALTAQDEAIATWTPPIRPNGKLLKYIVHLRVLDSNNRGVDSQTLLIPVTFPKEGSAEPKVRIEDTDEGAMNYRLPELRRNHRYEVWVTAHTSVGEGQRSSTVSLTSHRNVSAVVTSFGGRKVVLWRVSLRLGCSAVGEPTPTRRWLFNDEPLHLEKATESNSVVDGAGSRVVLASDGSVRISSVRRNDQGRYRCVVSNQYGGDEISHHLVVHVPPGAPLLLSTGSTAHTLQLQWKLGDDGGTPVRGFALHFKAEHGEWDEIRLNGSLSTHSLSGLRCGTAHQVYATAWNRVGSGPASTTLTARTRGGVPQMASAHTIVRPNRTSVELALDEWPDGGCPLLYCVVEFSQGTGEQRWLLASNNADPSSPYLLAGLSPSTSYRIRITAHNSAGSTTADYSASTLSALGGTVSPSQTATPSSRAPMSPDLRLAVMTSLAAAVLVVAFVITLFCLRKRWTSSSDGNQIPSPPDRSIGMQTPTQENKQNMARREQYYATVRKLPRTPSPPPPPSPPSVLPSPNSLHRIPEYAEDIRPYATFHVPVGPEATKLQTFTYRGSGKLLESGPSPSRRSAKQSEYSRPSRKGHSQSRATSQPDEYDSDGSESDTELGTSSRTESSNQLDEHGYHLHPHHLPHHVSQHHHHSHHQMARHNWNSPPQHRSRYTSHVMK